MHAVRSTRSLAVVRSLWQARDADARTRDISPGRVLPDAAIIAAAQAMPRSVAELVELKPFTGKGTRRRAEQWFAAIEAGLAVPDRELPPLRGPGTPGPPPPRMWRDRDPAAAERLAAARALVGELATAHHLPPENLLQPDLLRRVCWTPPSPRGRRGARRGAARRRRAPVAGRAARRAARRGACYPRLTPDTVV